MGVGLFVLREERLFRVLEKSCEKGIRTYKVWNNRKWKRTTQLV